MEVQNCRACEGNLTEFLDLGEQRISDFRLDDEPTKAYPIVGAICDDCKLVQLTYTTPSGEMYHENYGFKSGVSNSIKDDLAEVVSVGLTYDPKEWLDIASNDGTLLSFVPAGIKKVGVDPIKKYCLEATQHAHSIINGFYSSEYFANYNGGNGEKAYRTFDVISSISCFYDMVDPNKFVKEVKDVMHNKSVWIIQQNYLLTTLQLNAVDNFCHEHIEYYTLYSLEKLLEKHGLEVIDLSTSMVNGGSLRTMVAKKGAYPIQDSVEQQRTIEQDYGIDTMKPYEDFAKGISKNLLGLKSLIDELNAEGKKVYLLAASTRGATIWQAAHIGKGDVVAAIERNPEKVGKYFNAIGVPIVSEEEGRAKADYMVVGPWFFIDEIVEREAEFIKNGGKLICPLPEIKIYG